MEVGQVQSSSKEARFEGPISHPKSKVAAMDACLSATWFKLRANDAILCGHLFKHCGYILSKFAAEFLVKRTASKTHHAERQWLIALRSSTSLLVPKNQGTPPPISDALLTPFPTPLPSLSSSLSPPPPPKPIFPHLPLSPIFFYTTLQTQVLFPTKITTQLHSSPQPTPQPQSPARLSQLRPNHSPPNPLVLRQRLEASPRVLHLGFHQLRVPPHHRKLQPDDRRPR